MKGCGRVGWMLRSLGPEQKPLSHGGGAGSGKETLLNRKERVLKEGSLNGRHLVSVLFLKSCCNSGVKSNIAREYILISMTRHYMLISYCVVVLAACYCP